MFKLFNGGDRLKKMKLTLLFSIICLLLILPTAFAADGEDALVSSYDNSSVLTSDYYFDANAIDDSGNGSITNPYKQLTSVRIKDNSNIHLASGEYTLNIKKIIKNVTFIGSNASNTIIKFQGEGFDTFTLVTDQDGLIIIPTLPEGTTREGFIFDGWSDGAYIYKTGMKYNCVEKNNYTFTAVWKEVSGVGSDGTDDGDINFITEFFSDTFDKTKELVDPYLTEFEIPFLNITLAKVVRYVFYGLIMWFVILIISKILGAIL